MTDMISKPQHISEVIQGLTKISEIEKQREINDVNSKTITIPDEIINKEVICQDCGCKKVFDAEKYRLFCKKGYDDQRLKLCFADNCNCAELKKEKERQDEYARYKRVARIQDLKINYKKACFVRKLRGFRLNRIACEHIDLAKEYISTFKPFKSRGLLFIGSTGNGKTTLASCIGKELVLKGYKVLMMSFNDYLGALQRAEFAKDCRDREWLLNEWSKFDLLIIDDFGREKYTETRLVNTFTFFDKLVNECISFIITANPESISRIKDLPEFDAIFDRIAGNCIKLIFKASSFRRIKKEAQDENI